MSEQQYLDLAAKILNTGHSSGDRTGVGTTRLFGEQIRFDLSKGEFPLLTTKRVYFKAVVHELLWLLSGDTNIKYLTDNNIHIWDEWADANGDLGPVYGKQWRDFGGFTHRLIEGARSSNDILFQGVDQMADLVKRIKEKPEDRRLIVSAWNPKDVPNMALPPCHCFFQCFVQDGVLSLQLYQRSADLFLGVPFNIASYSLLLLMLAQVTGNKPGQFIHTFGDVHIYNNHREQMALQLSRTPRTPPSVELNESVENVFAFNYNDVLLTGYDPHPTIKAEVAV